MRRKFDAESGINLKKYIEIEDSSEVLVVKKKITFNSMDLESYKNMLSDLIDDEIIAECEFEDNIWIVSDDYTSYTLSFNYEIHPTINQVLKCYIVLKLAEKHISGNSAYNSLTHVQKTLLLSNLFNSENLIDYRDSINNWCDTDKQGLYYVREFLTFYSFNDADNYLKIIQGVAIPPAQTRLLPSYKSILKFHYLLTEYLAKADRYEKEKYYPLFLWWLITKIIPMRPIEFNILSRNCVFYDKDTDSYYIKIERKKLKNGFLNYKKLESLNDIKIPKDIYDLVQEYANMVDPECKNERLLSYASYCKHHFKVRKGPTKNKKDSSIMTISELRKVLVSFFKDVVANTYTVIEKGNGFEDVKENEIERICLGDTRHIAFCEMLLQGLNPLTIAQIGGHYTLREQMSYHNHMTTYVDARTYLLAKTLCEKMYKSSHDIDIYTDIKEGIITRVQLGDSFYKLRKVPGGRCTNKNFPHQCIADECIFHKPYFVPDETLTQDVLDSITTKVNKELATKLEHIQTLVKGIKVLDSGVYDLKNQETLKTQYNSLNALVNKKALVEAYRMKMEGK